MAAAVVMQCPNPVFMLMGLGRVEKTLGQGFIIEFGLQETHNLQETHKWNV